MTGKPGELGAAPNTPSLLVREWHIQLGQAHIADSPGVCRGRGRRRQQGCIAVQLLQTLMVPAAAWPLCGTAAAIDAFQEGATRTVVTS